MPMPARIPASAMARLFTDPRNSSEAPVMYRSSIPVPAAKAATAANTDPEATKNRLAGLGPSLEVNARRRQILANPTGQWVKDRDRDLMRCKPYRFTRGACGTPRE